MSGLGAITPGEGTANSQSGELRSRGLLWRDVVLRGHDLPAAPALDPRIGEPIPTIEFTGSATTSHDEPPRHNGRHSAVAMYGHRLVVRCHDDARSCHHRLHQRGPILH